MIQVRPRSSPKMIVLDTNVVSELMRSEPEERVVAWATSQATAAVGTTSVTLAEVRSGIVRLPAGRRRKVLLSAAEDVFSAFASSILPFDADAAHHYADIVVERERAGAPISGFDAQIAAICRAHGAALATRNTEDFVGLGLSLTNPWGVGATA